MTDKEKILAFLEGMSKGCCPKETKEIIINKIIPWINDLPKEPVSEDFKIALEKKVREAQDWTYIEEEGCECPLSEEFGAYDLEEFARWGANWQITKLVEEAGEHEVKVDAGGYPYIPQIELYDYIKDSPLAKEGDKYKVILIKE